MWLAFSVVTTMLICRVVSCSRVTSTVAASACFPSFIPPLFCNSGRSAGCVGGATNAAAGAVTAAAEQPLTFASVWSRHHATVSLRASAFNRDAVLTSTKSATVKVFRALIGKKRKRTEENETVIEGQRLVLDMLDDPITRRLVRHVVVAKSALDHKQLGPKLESALGRFDAMQDVSVSVASVEVVEACCDTVTPQGIVAIASLPSPYEGPIEGGNTKCPLYLVLDGLSDPGNVGTLLRSALACGVEAVILMPGSCDVWNPKAIRSAMGATFKIPLRRVEDWEDCRRVLGSFGVQLNRDFYAATMEGSEEKGDCADSHSLAYHEVDWSGRQDKNDSIDRKENRPNSAKVVCIGKEGPGLSSEIRAAVRSGDIRSVHVPMEEGIESLNAAVCGSVILFETLRQRGEH